MAFVINKDKIIFKQKIYECRLEKNNNNMYTLKEIVGKFGDFEFVYHSPTTGGKGKRIMGQLCMAIGN